MFNYHFDSVFIFDLHKKKKRLAFMILLEEDLFTLRPDSRHSHFACLLVLARLSGRTVQALSEIWFVFGFSFVKNSQIYF